MAQIAMTTARPQIGGTSSGDTAAMPDQSGEGGISRRRRTVANNSQLRKPLHHMESCRPVVT
jgi:hypothetical protein